MDNNKPQLIDLWRTSFDDSEEFIKLFFDRVYKKENALFIEKDGKIVSALQMLPYVMTYYGTEISVSYIYGACTLPSERGQGFMRQLIQKAFEVMESRKVALTVIIPADPWLFDYYRDLGYTEAFDYSEETYIRPIETAWDRVFWLYRPKSLRWSLSTIFSIRNSGNALAMCCTVMTISSLSCAICRCPAGRC